LLTRSECFSLLGQNQQAYSFFLLRLFASYHSSVVNVPTTPYAHQVRSATNRRSLPAQTAQACLGARFFGPGWFLRRDTYCNPTFIPCQDTKNRCPPAFLLLVRTGCLSDAAVLSSRSVVNDLASRPRSGCRQATPLLYGVGAFCQGVRPKLVDRISCRSIVRIRAFPFASGCPTQRGRIIRQAGGLSRVFLTEFGNSLTLISGSRLLGLGRFPAGFPAAKANYMHTERVVKGCFPNRFPALLGSPAALG
jgi:hypothetical protein